MSDKEFSEGLAKYKQSKHTNIVFLKFLESEETGILEKGIILYRELSRVQALEEVDPTKPKAAKTIMLPKLETPTDDDDQDCRVIVNVSAKSKKDILKVVHSPVNPDEMPSDIRAIYDANGTIYSKMKELDAINKDKSTPVEQGAKALQELVELEEEYNKNWDDIDAWYLASIDTDPEKENKALALKVHKLTVRKANVENYIRRYKNDADKKSEYTEELKKISAELNILIAE